MTNLSHGVALSESILRNRFRYEKADEEIAGNAHSGNHDLLPYRPFGSSSHHSLLSIVKGLEYPENGSFEGYFTNGTQHGNNLYRLLTH